MKVGRLKEAINYLLSGVSDDTEVESVFFDGDVEEECYFNLEVISDLKSINRVVIRLTSEEGSVNDD